MLIPHFGTLTVCPEPSGHSTSTPPSSCHSQPASVQTLLWLKASQKGVLQSRAGGQSVLVQAALLQKCAFLSIRRRTQSSYGQSVQ